MKMTINADRPGLFRRLWPPPGARMRSELLPTAARNKCLARNNKSRHESDATKKHGAFRVKGKNTNGNETRADRHRCGRTRNSCHCDRRASRNHLHQSWVLGNRNANLPPWRCLSRIALREPPRRWEAQETGTNNQGILVTPQVVQARRGGFLVSFPTSKQKSDLRSCSRA